MTVDWWTALVRAGLGIHEGEAGQWFARCSALPDGQLGPFPVVFTLILSC